MVLIRFPFTDLSDSKVRPALVVRDQVGDDVVLLPISSSFGRTESDLFIDADKVEGFVFPIRSYIKVRKPMTLEGALVRKRLGRLRSDFFDVVKTTLLQFLKG